MTEVYSDPRAHDGPPISYGGDPANFENRSTGAADAIIAAKTPLLRGQWRHAIGWLYVVVVACDFIIFPVEQAAYAAYFHLVYAQWQPLTLQGGGMFHVAMLAILGVQMWRLPNIQATDR